MAVLAIGAGRRPPVEAAAFHAQQCIEKYLKAALVAKGIDFPRTHDIDELVALLPKNAVLDIPVEQRRRLTSYAIIARYPGDFEPISMAEAREALRVARRVKKAIRKILPKEALARRKRK